MKKTWSTSVTSLLLSGLVLSALACESKKNSDFSVAIKSAADAGVVYGDYSIRPVLAKEKINFSVAALVEKSSLKQEANQFTVEDISVQERFGTCENLSLSSEMSAAKCTGVLIKDDLVATAGHCLSPALKCQDLALVFGFQAQASDRMSLDRQNVYNCKAVKIDRQKDIAYIQLDRKVAQFKPVKTLQKFSLGALLGVQVYSLGHPLGTALKRTEGFIRGYDSKTHVIKTTLDAFDRNSGSPVFLSETNELLGILLNGEMDFFENSSQSCQQVVHCEENECVGESVLAIDQIIY
jgi:hypothetical protein